MKPTKNRFKQFTDNELYVLQGKTNRLALNIIATISEGLNGEIEDEFNIRDDE